MLKLKALKLASFLAQPSERKAQGMLGFPLGSKTLVFSSTNVTIEDSIKRVSFSSVVELETEMFELTLASIDSRTLSRSPFFKAQLRSPIFDLSGRLGRKILGQKAQNSFSSPGLVDDDDQPQRS